MYSFASVILNKVGNMTGLNENEMKLLYAIIKHEFNDIHQKLDDYKNDDMYSEMVEDMDDYIALLKLMDEFSSNGPVLEWLDEFPPMGTFKRYINNQDLEEIVEYTAENEGLEDYVDGVVKFLKN